MTEEYFIEMHQDKWKKLSEYCLRLQKSHKLSSTDTKEFLTLYKEASYNLAFVKTHFPSGNAISYLNSVVASCHNCIYIKDKVGFKTRVLNYINLVHDERRMILISALIFLIGGLVAFIRTRYKREIAIVQEVKKAGHLMIGVVILLIFAAMIEGYITPLVMPAVVKYLVFIVCVCILIAIYSIPLILKKKGALTNE